MNVPRLWVTVVALFVSPPIACCHQGTAIQGTAAVAVAHKTVMFGGRQPVISAEELSSTAAPPTVSSFPAYIRDGSVGSIPDTMGAVGPNHLMIAINGKMIIQTRQGVVVGSQDSGVFWSAVGTNVDAFDPRVTYDPYENRWVVSSAARAGGDSAAPSLLLGVSETSDPTASWHLYRMDADPTHTAWADMPRLAFNSRWIVLQANMEPLNPPYTEANRSHLFVINKTNVYAGGVGTYTYISVPADQFQSYDIVPAITYSPTAPNMYALALRPNERGSWVDYPPVVRIYEIAGNLGSETITFRTNAVASVTWAPGRGEASAPQLGTSTRIIVREKTLETAIFRNASLWTVHNVYPDVTNSVTGLQWWQISTNGAVLQFGRLYDATNHYGFPGLAVNARNDVLIGYSRFSATQYVSANYAFRAAEDPPNTLRSDTVLKAGEAPFTWNTTDPVRWGDYSHTSVDPLNDVDFWTIQQYAATPDAFTSELRYGLWWGRIVPPENWPRFTSIQKNTDQLALSFTSSVGNSYSLERTMNLLPTNWQVIANNITGNGSGIQVVLTNASPGFYRLRILP